MAVQNLNLFYINPEEYFYPFIDGVKELIG